MQRRPSFREIRCARATPACRSIANSSPTISGGNEIYDNSFNIMVAGVTGFANPAPVVTGNRLYSPYSGGYNYYTSGFTNGTAVALNATGNWWGTSVLATIAARIYDYTDNDTQRRRL